MTAKITATTRQPRTRRTLDKIALAGLLALTAAGFETPACAANFVTDGLFDTGNTGFGALGGGLNTGDSAYTTGGSLGPSATPYWTVVNVGSSTGLAFLYDAGPQGSTTANSGITQAGRFGNFALWDPGNTTSGTLGAIPNTSPGGGNFIVADGGTSYQVAIYQSLTGLTAGTVYSLSFWYAAGQQTVQSGATTEAWQVSFGNSAILTQGGTAAGTTVVTTTQPGGTLASHGFQAWTQATFNFTAQGSTQILTFLSEGTPNSEPPIDLLSDVTLIAAPEPASLALFGTGIVSLIGLVWFRKNRVRQAAPRF